MQILDVRERAEWDERPHPGSIFTPYHDVRGIPDGLDPAAPDRRDLQLGPAQRRGRQPAASATAHEHVLHVVDGGVGTWAAAGLAGRGAGSESQPEASRPRGRRTGGAGLSFPVVAEVDLNVVCKNCGSEVSPYITECPYCGQRLRKRAPKLRQEGEGVELAPAPQRRRRLRRARKPAIEERPLSWLSAERPYATIALVLASAAVLPRRARRATSASTTSARDRAARRRLVAPGRGAVRVRERRLPVRRRRRRRDLRHEPRAPLRPARPAGGLPRQRARPACTWRARSADFPVAMGGNASALGLLCAWLVRDLRDRRAGEDTETDLFGVVAIAACSPLMPLLEADRRRVGRPRRRRRRRARRAAAAAARLATALDGDPARLAGCERADARACRRGRRQRLLHRVRPLGRRRRPAARRRSSRRTAALAPARPPRRPSARAARPTRGCGGCRRRARPPPSSSSAPSIAGTALALDARLDAARERQLVQVAEQAEPGHVGHRARADGDARPRRRSAFSVVITSVQRAHDRRRPRCRAWPPS